MVQVITDPFKVWEDTFYSISKCLFSLFGYFILYLMDYHCNTSNIVLIQWYLLMHNNSVKCKYSIIASVARHD